MKVGRFGVVSSRERREANRFFADLMGLAPRTGLAGRSWLAPSAQVAEQFARVAPALPVPIVTKWTGVDRSSIPRRIVAGNAVADTAWMGTLIDNSTLRFTGAYVAGVPLPGRPVANFTKSSKATGRGWLPNIQTLTDQGWGAVFFFVGYSVGGGEPAPGGVSRARGTEHGLHLRTTLHALGPAWAGATVFIDNEDSVETTLPNNLIEYYLGLFEEMSRPDPNLAAFRPALYGHGQPVEQLLARRRDLFVWDVQLATRTTTTPTPAFDPAIDPITVDPISRPLRAYQATPTGQRPFVTWSLGRQFWFYTGAMPATGSAVAVRLPAWRRENTWDYDVSFVRNPAFPVAEPRIAARGHGAAAVAIAGFFEGRGAGPPPTPPSARLATQGPTRSAPMAVAGVTVEPDAPLTLFPRSNDMLLATILSGGGIGVATRTAAGTWSAIDRIAGMVPSLRRSRALVGVSNAVSSAHLFFFGSDDRLYVKRLTGTGAWSDGQAAATDLTLHPFSALAGEARRADTVDTFFIDARGLLTTAYWARWFKTPFPSFLVQRLETTPSLLPGGALAAVCPQPDHLLVFGVGNDQRLRFASFLHGRGWSTLAPVGAGQDLIGAHGRLAAHAVSATEVEVAALTDSGQLTLYALRLTASTWSAGARQVIVDPPALAGAAPRPPANAVLQPAAGFRINPFGDLAILRQHVDRSSTVFCAGLRGGDARTLRWNAAGPDAWQWFPDLTPAAPLAGRRQAQAAEAMRDPDDRNRRQTNLYRTDLVERRGPRRGWAAATLADELLATESLSEASVSAGRLFDEVVHRGMSPSALLAEADAEDTWETLALPRSTTPPQALPRGALVVERALGDGRLACMHVLGHDVQVQQLYGPDGRIRAGVLVVATRTAARPAAQQTAEIAEATEDSDLSFLRWSPGSRASYFPPRDKAALSGRAFMETIKGESAPTNWEKRENAIVAQLVAGNMPDALLRWIKIDLTYRDKTRTITGTIEVLPDYLSVGRNDDFVYVPLDPVSAQLVADRFDTLLPSARICHAIYRQTAAKNRINAIERDYYYDDARRKSAKRGRAQTSTAAYLEHSDAIQARMKSLGISLGELVAGHKKDVVIAKRLHEKPEHIAFHGFYDNKEFPHEPCYDNLERTPKPSCKKENPTLAHHRRFSDYNQGIRLIHPWMIVNGERQKVADVLAHPDLSYLISSEGPIVPARIPRTVKPKLGPAKSAEDARKAEAQPVSTVSAVTIEAAPGLGSERTVAPLAVVSPQRQMNEVLDRELILLARARIVADWIGRTLSATFQQALADSALMSRLDVSKDKALLGKLRPFPQGRIPAKRGQLFTTDAVLQDLLKPPTDAAGLQRILDVLQHYGVIMLPPNARDPSGRPSMLAQITRVEARLERTRFDTDSAAVERRAVQFKRAVADKGMLHHAVEAEAIPADWSAGKTGTKLEVAKPVVALLRRLRERNQGWRAGTYPGHFWNDFSVDAFIVASIGSDGFWARDKVSSFFRSLNAACEQDVPPGRFAWRAIYNDAGLAQEMDGLYGAGRVLHGVEGHGPGPRMHLHLDMRPLTVPFDATTGFWLQGARVALSPPTALSADT